jgi:hypothetical protein
VVWQDRIAELKALEPRYVYPGHGAPGGPELLDQTLAYLKFFHETVASHVKAGGPARISGGEAMAIKQMMIAHYPKLGRPELLDKAIPAEYAVQIRELPAQPVAEPGAQPAAATGQAAATPSPSPAPSAATPPPAKQPAKQPAAATTTTASDNSSVDDLLNSVDNKSSKKKKKR